MTKISREDFDNGEFTNKIEELIRLINQSQFQQSSEELDRLEVLKTQAINFWNQIQIKQKQLSAIFDRNSDKAGQLELDKQESEGKLSKLINNINELISRIPKETQSSINKTEEIFPSFTNRDREKEEILRDLKNPDGVHFYFISAPPQMGKTWLLKQVERELSQSQDSQVQWNTFQWVNLRNGQSSYRNDVGQILQVFFGDCLEGELQLGNYSEEESKTIALRLAQRLVDKSRLCILDGAEFLQESSIKNLRNFFNQTSSFLRENPKEKLGLFVLSRRSTQKRHWINLQYQPRFKDLELTDFEVQVIQKLISMAEAPKNDPRTLEEQAKLFLDISEGLPGLLCNYAEWAKNQCWMGINQERIQSAQDRNQKNIQLFYIESHILSPESLRPLPQESNQEDLEKSVLKKICLKLSPYRVFTHSHLKHLIEEIKQQDQEFNGQLNSLNWTREEKLFTALIETCLTTYADSRFKAIHKPIRRLLFRHHFSINEQQKQAHEVGLNFYVDWWQKHKDEILLIEQIWHKVEICRLDLSSSSSNLCDSEILEFARRLFQDIYQESEDRLYNRSEIGESIQQRLNKDEELQKSLAEINTDLYGILVQCLLDNSLN